MAAPTGNQNARKGKEWADALRVALKTYKDGEIKRGHALRKIAEQCVKQALAGDKDARIEIANRLDGKAVQPIAGDADSPPIQTVTRIELVDLVAKEG